MNKKDICVIGVGKFGAAAVEKLLEVKKNVLVIDKQEEAFENINAKGFDSAILNASNIEALKMLNIDKYLNVIVAVGNSIAASILICSLLVDFKIPNIVAKAIDERHEKILRKIGVHDVIRSEKIGGAMAALKTVYEIGASFSILSNDFSIIAVTAKNPKILGKPLHKLNLRSSFACNVIGIKTQKDIWVFPKNFTVLKSGDEIYFAVRNRKINALRKYFS